MNLEKQAASISEEAQKCMKAKKPWVLSTKDFSIADLYMLARLMSSKYAAAMRGDVEEQRVYQNLIFGLLTAATGAMLFEGETDLIKGLTLGAGTIYAYGELTLDSDRRQIFQAASEAYACIAAKAGAVVPAGSPFASYTDKTQMLGIIVKEMSNKYIAITELVSASSPICQSCIKKEDLQLMEEIMDIAHKSFHSAYHIGEKMYIFEESILNEIIKVDRIANYELAKIEPDFTSFSNSIYGSLSHGMSLVAQGGVPAAPHNLNTISYNMLLTITIYNNCSTDECGDFLDSYKEKVSAFLFQWSRFKQQYLELDPEGMKALLEGVDREGESSKECWQYTAAPTGVTAEPAHPMLEGDTNATQAVVISGLKGTLHAEVIDKFSIMNVSIRSYTGDSAILILFMSADNVDGDKNVRVLVSDSHGSSKILNVGVSNATKE